jgi:PAS domain S-box-containing protein
MRLRRTGAAARGEAGIDATARAILHCAPDPVIALGQDRTVRLWNPAAEAMFGWTAADVIGLELPIIPGELQAEHNAVLERTAGGGPVCLATRRMRKDGEVLDLRVDTSALRDPAGEFLGWMSICQRSADDAAGRHGVAERARLVRRLGDVVADLNSELDLPVVLDRIAASLRELTKADAGGFALIERDTLRLVSLDGLPAELRGRTASLTESLVGELMRSGKTVLLARAGQPRFGDLIWSALPGLHTIALSLSYVAGRPYGALYALYSGRAVGHLELELLELLAGHASVALTNASAYAEVDRQRAHERAVIDGTADGIAVLDAGGAVRQWNPAAHTLTGVPADRAIGTQPPFPLPEPGATLTHRLPNGRWIDVLRTRLAGRDEQVIDFRDVTTAKQLEEAKDLFLATTSHELRTPITVVQGFARTLASRWDKLPEQDRHSAVQTIAERAGSLAKLVDQLLLGSKAGTGQLAVTVAQFDLAAVLRGTVAGFAQLSEAHRLVTEIPAELAACGDPLATDIIIGQLLENAFKYSPDGGEVTVTARAGNAQTEVSVADRGIGIPAADRERVFERFVQAEAGDRRRFGGIGLGLYIVRQLARAQGGEVSAEGRPGGGTVLRLRLRAPASRGQAAGGAQDDGPATAAADPAGAPAVPGPRGGQPGMGGRGQPGPGPGGRDPGEGGEGEPGGSGQRAAGGGSKRTAKGGGGGQPGAGGGQPAAGGGRQRAAKRGSPRGAGDGQGPAADHRSPPAERALPTRNAKPPAAVNGHLVPPREADPGTAASGPPPQGQDADPGTAPDGGPPARRDADRGTAASGRPPAGGDADHGTAASGQPPAGREADPDPGPAGQLALGGDPGPGSAPSGQPAAGRDTDPGEGSSGQLALGEPADGNAVPRPGGGNDRPAAKDRPGRGGPAEPGRRSPADSVHPALPRPRQPGDNAAGPSGS